MQSFLLPSAHKMKYNWTMRGMEQLSGEEDLLTSKRCSKNIMRYGHGATRPPLRSLVGYDGLHRSQKSYRPCWSFYRWWKNEACRSLLRLRNIIIWNIWEAPQCCVKSTYHSHFYYMFYGNSLQTVWFLRRLMDVFWFSGAAIELRSIQRGVSAPSWTILNFRQKQLSGLQCILRTPQNAILDHYTLNHCSLFYPVLCDPWSISFIFCFSNNLSRWVTDLSAMIAWWNARL